MIFLKILVKKNNCREKFIEFKFEIYKHKLFKYFAEMLEFYNLGRDLEN